MDGFDTLADREIEGCGVIAAKTDPFAGLCHAGPRMLRFLFDGTVEVSAGEKMKF